jgi:FkbM family methyltransferase
MTASAIGILGSAARLARGAGLGRPLGAIRDGIDAAALRLARPPLRARADGLELRGYLRHRSFLADLERGYERTAGELLARALVPGSAFVDGGAHIGLWTLHASRRVGPSGRVLAVEPDPYNAHALRANVLRAGCTNVDVIEGALAAGEGEQVLFQAASTISSSLARRSAGITPVRELTVRTTTIDALLGGAGLLEGDVVVKLDLEGAEPLAAEGMRAAVARARTFACLVELNPEALESAGSSPEALVAALRALDLTVALVDEERHLAVPVEELAALRKGDLYCERQAATR